MKKVKIISLLMAALLLATIFVGCTAAPEPEQPSEPVVTSTPTPPAETNTPEPLPEEEELSYRTEEFRVQNGEKSIYGEMYIPLDAEGALPTVILSHGFGGSLAQGVTLAPPFVEQGYLVYAFDFCGGGTKSQSDGKTTEMSVLTEVADLNAVIDALREADIVDENNIFLFGSSQGGAVSALAAASRPEDVRGLVMQFPAFVVRDDMHETYASLDEVADVVRFMGMDIGRIYYEDMWDYDVYEHIGNYKGDVLIFHGTSDQIVPVSYSERAAEVYESAHLEIFEGESHGFRPPQAEIVIEMTLDYIAAHIV